MSEPKPTFFSYVQCVVRYCVMGAAISTVGLGGLFLLLALVVPYGPDGTTSPSSYLGDSVVVALFVAIAHVPVTLVNVIVACPLFVVSEGRANRVASLATTIFVASVILALFGATADMRQALHELYLGDGVAFLFPALSVLAFASPCILGSERARLYGWVRGTNEEP